MLPDPAFAGNDCRRDTFLKIQLRQFQAKFRRVDSAGFWRRRRLLAAGRALPPREQVGLLLNLLGLVYRFHR